MSIETDFKTAMAAAGVAALVSTRVYANLAPEDATFPMIVYFVVSGERLHTLPGSGDPDRKRIQASCHGQTYASAVAVADAVIAALQGNGYLQLIYDLYDPETQVHTRIVDWSFIA